MNFRDYINSVRAAGYYHFTSSQAIAALNISRNALYSAINKLKKKNEVVSPAKNLYVIIPPEYQAQGCIPAEELIPILMKHWNVPYYVCGLSAAYYYGASHQKPQVFQVMTNKQLKNITLGKIKIIFFYKKNWEQFIFTKRVVKTGYLSIASAELTAKDILMYPKMAGGLNSVATVLSELIEEINIDSLLEIITKGCENAWWQRLGYILEHIDVMDEKKLKLCIRALRQYASKQQLSWVRLTPELEAKGASRDILWKIIANTTVEADE